jgi:thiosulfate/3-mercaptopyruvate sulfurtransferase
MTTATNTQSQNPKFAQYAHPESIVDTQWVSENLNNPNVCIIESNEDVLLYDTGHIPNAVHIDWRRDLQSDPVRDYISPVEFSQLCQKHGITEDTLCVFYGDKSNWWACYAFWTFSLFGHKNLAMMDGGRNKWISEGRELSRSITACEASQYPVPKQRDDSTDRAFYESTLAHANVHKPLVDVRSPGEFIGEVTHMPDYPQEGVLRGGHIPGAKSCPWARAANDDGTFKTTDELKAIYHEELGLKKDEETIVYCRIGERSSHTWFVLKYLLGHTNVRNYDGSWTEWGNRVRSPIQKDC